MSRWGIGRFRRGPWTGVALALILLPVSGWGADPFKGKEYYQKNCRRCHGERGEAQFAGVPQLNWRGGANSGLLKTDREVVIRLLSGKNACPSYRGILTERELLDIIAHMRVFYQ